MLEKTSSECYLVDIMERLPKPTDAITEQSEITSKGIEIDRIYDGRLDAMFKDPEAYFSDARKRIRAEVEADMAREQDLRNRTD